MLEKLSDIEQRFVEIERLMLDPAVLTDQKQYARLAKEHAGIARIVEGYRNWKKVESEIDGMKELLESGDEAIRDLAKEEIPILKQRKEEIEKMLRELLLPTDPDDDKNVLLEIRGGTGGEEASLFVADLFRMYSRYAETKGWRIEVMSSNPTGLGGFKEIIGMVEGDRVYSLLKYEGGVHRVQRIPVTEASGRIHTSAVTVAVMPEADELEVELDPKDLRIDVFRSSGPGGQSVNTTDSAVRITHIPSGTVVSCQDEKSQHKNRSKALKILRARLLDRALHEQQSEIAASRKKMVGSGDRSERIRTYNFPQNRVTDHRIGLTLHKLDRVMEGDLDGILQALAMHAQAENLKLEMGETVGPNRSPT